jgi:hypothetical protein
MMRFRSASVIAAQRPISSIVRPHPSQTRVFRSRMQTWMQGVERGGTEDM